jgi:pilus assembly protein CpaC
VGSADKVVNSIAVRGRDQVMLKVTVAEVARSVIKQLGIDLSATMNYGTTAVTFDNNNPFTALGRSLAGNSAVAGFGSATRNGVPVPSIQATIRAMEGAGVIRTLAEPNLTAISGESATFIAGGEFPIPAGYSCDPITRACTTQISFKKFGISLNFTPVVMTEGRISLRVMTEVSELSNDNSITLNQAGSSLTIPSVKTRRAETTLEIPSGGAMAMAGLIQDQTKQAINGLIVTPFIVRAVAQKDLSRPDDGFAAASDPQADLIGNINRIYGVPGRVEPARNYRGTYGFITD